MQKQRFLMCAPDYFGVHYVINPWMEGHINDTESQLATTQWNQLYAIVQQFADVNVLPSAPGLPDLVFTANAAVVRNDQAILSSFLYPERQPEEPKFQGWLASNGFEVHTLPRNVSFEGAGDALFDRATDRLWFGHGVRSSLTAMPYLERIFNVAVQPLSLLQTRYYHLDTCFCPLEGGFLLYYPDAFDEPSVAAIESLVPAAARLAVPSQDAEDFACNAINIGNTVILNKISSNSREWLTERGFQVIETPTSEFLKAGGSTKCLSLRLDEMPPAKP
jgi:N-dimethylarginine dimethylaminohydrolase